MTNEMESFPARLRMLLFKLIGIKGVIWLTGTVFLWFGKIASTDWVLLSIAFGSLNVAQKYFVPQPATLGAK
jgi:hypothetical protein